jgi:hypothetical protein
MTDGYHYDDVPAILEGLQAEGLPLSAGRVYERRRRRGSLQSCQEDINRWKREHGLISAEEDQEAQEDMAVKPVLAGDYSPPAPDPELIAVIREALHNEGAFDDELKAAASAAVQLETFFNAAAAAKNYTWRVSRGEWDLFGYGQEGALWRWGPQMAESLKLLVIDATRRAEVFQQGQGGETNGDHT